ncbi:MAG TPA: helix-turn-helix domain-containing protein, partial [Streptosporangiaceae bacterium]|nr:helix-turn-helix domain-containing protein [Streptosporangiaceae bacterium]
MVAGSSPQPAAIGPAPRYPIESVDNALQLLLLFAENPRVRLTDASKELGVASSTAHRLLAMLQYRGYVQQDPSRAYKAGPVLRQIGLAAMRQADLSEAARPVLERLHDDLDGATTIGKLEGQHVVYVDQVPNDRVAPLP